ncbi:MAG: hypothetical protein GY796_14910 [Chloroflexi bacterium]|nr:hypothetical protein [Chloroflexota bacterium]
MPDTPDRTNPFCLKRCTGDANRWGGISNAGQKNMWTSRSKKLTTGRGFQVFVEFNAKPATFADVLHGWQNDVMFRSMFNALLADTPFSAFRWETPPVTINTIEQPFEFIVLDSPMLARHPDPEVFAEHFNKSPQKNVLVFSNLGGDAIMIVPQLKTTVSAYGHLAAFVREAPDVQRHALWKLVGEVMSQRVSIKPVWLSTAGGGVSWLHVRLDDRPKYYGFGPYRQIT